MPNFGLNKILQIIFGATLLLALPDAQALVIHSIEVTCPIDGEKFRADQAASYTVAGQFLDMKPFGATIAPPPLPKCPTSRFLIYKENFSEAEIQTLKEFVSSNQWRRLIGRNTDYYLIAKLRAHLGETPAQLKFVLLQATWEPKSQPKYRQYAKTALEAYNEALKGEYVDRQQWLSDQLVAGELERRLRQFDKALIRFASLSTYKEAQAGVFQRIVALQLKLIHERNAEPKKIL
jgi:hypothetical protein